MLQQPEELAGVGHDRVSQRGEVLVGEQPDHLGQSQRACVPVVGVEEYDVAHPVGVVEREVDRDGSGGVVGDQRDRFELERVDDGVKVLFWVEDLARGAAIRAAVTEEVEGHGAPGHEKWREVVIDV